jgi:hypothetical protein
MTALPCVCARALEANARTVNVRHLCLYEACAHTQYAQMEIRR